MSFFRDAPESGFGESELTTGVFGWRTAIASFTTLTSRSCGHGTEALEEAGCTALLGTLTIPNFFPAISCQRASIPVDLAASDIASKVVELLLSITIADISSSAEEGPEGILKDTTAPP